MEFTKDVDDKSLVIMAVFLLCAMCIAIMGQDALEVVEKSLYGLFGMAVGKQMNGNEGRVPPG